MRVDLKRVYHGQSVYSSLFTRNRMQTTDRMGVSTRTNKIQDGMRSKKKSVLMFKSEIGEDMARPNPRQHARGRVNTKLTNIVSESDEHGCLDFESKRPWDAKRREHDPGLLRRYLCSMLGAVSGASVGEPA